MSENGRAWLLTRWRIRLGQLPRSAARVQVRTQAYESRMSLNRRCFSLHDESGAQLAVADSLWSLADRTTGAPVSALQEVQPYLEPGDGPQLGDMPRRVAIPAEAVSGTPFAITDDLLDTNHHVNNVRSVSLALRFVPAEFAFQALAVDYHRPLLPGQMVTPRTAPTKSGFAVALCVDDQICVSAEFIR